MSERSAVFDNTQVSPELLEPLKRFPTVRLDRKPLLVLARLATMLSRTSPTGGVDIQNLVDKLVTVRIYRPERVRSTGAGLLWMHGGGLIAGDPKMDDALLGRVVHDLGITVFSVKYRLAPKHPYPAPLDDCRDAWDWLQNNAKRFGVDPRRIALGGESAGGSLAAALSQLLVDDPATNQPQAVWLMCPMLDDRTAVRSDIGDTDHRIWNNGNNRFAWKSYLGVNPGAAVVPRGAVPARRENLYGLPPTWIGIAALDLFADEDREYARRLKEADVDTDTDVVPGALHGFQSWAADTELSRSYLARASTWLGHALGLTADTA